MFDKKEQEINTSRRISNNVLKNDSEDINDVKARLRKDFQLKHGKDKAELNSFVLED